MTLDPSALIGVAGTLAAIPLTGWVTIRITARTEAKAERDALGAQFDAMLLAVAGLRAAIETDHVLWSNWKEQFRTLALASVTGLAPASFVKGSDRRQIAAALGGAGWFLAHERHQMRVASGGITPKLEAVVAAAAPLLRHSDARIRETTDSLVKAAYRYHEKRNPTELEATIADFGEAVRVVLYPTRRRLLRRRRQAALPAAR